MNKADMGKMIQVLANAVPRVKVCGMTDMDSIRMAVQYGANAVGFITEVPVKTHRRIDRKTAQTLTASTPPFVTTVMVCMPGDPDNALELIRYVRPDAIQIHSQMSFEDLTSIKESTHIKIIKTIHINEDTSAIDTIHYISELRPVIDAILLDSSVGGKTGGTGTVHDWAKSKSITAGSSLPVILAGGLHPGNVDKAVRTVKPYGVDTASGAETNEKKDEEKIRLFIEHARGHL